MSRMNSHSGESDNLEELAKIKQMIVQIKIVIGIMLENIALSEATRLELLEKLQEILSEEDEY